MAPVCRKEIALLLKIAHLEAGHVLKMILQYHLMVEDHKKIAILLLQCVSAYFLFVSIIFQVVSFCHIFIGWPSS
jgi:hypothetical protein